MVIGLLDVVGNWRWFLTENPATSAAARALGVFQKEDLIQFMISVDY
jgi:hypothetical protein